MWNEGEETKVEQASIFKCENGFGIETLTAIGEEGIAKRYIASDLAGAIELVKQYFKGELNA